MAKSKEPFRKGAYICRHSEWLDSPAYRDLSPVARCLIEEFQRLIWPDRNGSLSIPVKRASGLLGCHPDTAGRAFHELAEHGFIVLREGEYWQERVARKWELTIERFNGREPSDKWRDWELGKPVVVLAKRSKTRPQSKGQFCPKIVGRLA
jgi:hypothetical protein